MESVGRSKPEHSQAFVDMITTLSRVATLNRAHEITMGRGSKHTLVAVDGHNNFDPDLVIGREAVSHYKKDGVTHEIKLHLYNEAAQISEDNQTAASVYINAAEGDNVSPQEIGLGLGVLCGLILIDKDGTAFADFGHGTHESKNASVQKRLEEMVAAFGVPAEIISHDSSALFTYDEAAMERLSENLPLFDWQPL